MYDFRSRTCCFGSFWISEGHLVWFGTSRFAASPTQDRLVGDRHTSPLSPKAVFFDEPLYLMNQKTQCLGNQLVQSIILNFQREADGMLKGCCMISLERNGLIPKVRRLTLHFSFFPLGLNFIYSVFIVYLFLGPILGCTGYPVEFGFTEHSGMIWNHDPCISMMFQALLQYPGSVQCLSPDQQGAGCLWELDH